MATKYTFYYSDTTKTEFSVYPYTANGPKSPSDPTLIDHASAQTTTLKLYGKGMSDYGEGIEQNLIYMLEHFANSTSPVNPKEGQLWYNNVGVPVGSPIIGPVGPQLNIYTASAWDAVILATGTSHMTGELILSGNPVNDLGAVPKQYIEIHTLDATLHLTSDQDNFLNALDLPTLTAAEVNALKGLTTTGSPALPIPVQTQLDNINADKLSRTGDIMDAAADFSLNGGNLNVGVAGSPGSGGNVLINGGTILGLTATPSDPTEATSKAFVEAFVISGAGGDGVLSNVVWLNGGTGSPLPDINETSIRFTITYPSPSPAGTIQIDGVSRVGHGHAATEITFDNSGSPILSISGATVQDVIENIDLIKAPKASPTLSGVVTVTGSLNVNGGGSFGSQVSAAEPVNSNHLATKNYVDNIAGGGTGGVTVTTGVAITRSLEILASDITTPTPFPVQAHIHGTDKFSVTINGIKQYKHTHATQSIQYASSVGLIDEAAYTGLDQTIAYDFAVSIDGGGAITVTIPIGTNTITHGSLVTAINNAMQTGSPILVRSLFGIEDDDVQIFTSYTSATGSTITISDPATGGSPQTLYLFATDPSPTAIDSAIFRSDSPIGSPIPIPDDIIIAGDVTALFPAGKFFTIRGSLEATYGQYDSVYAVHANGPVYPVGSPASTAIPIAWVGDFNMNIPLLGAYQPGGSPAPAYPSPSPFGSVHFTPIGGFEQVLTAVAGVSGDYEETDSIGTELPLGAFTDHITLNYTIPSGNTLETILLV